MDGARLLRWVDGFVERHGPLSPAVPAGTAAGQPAGLSLSRVTSAGTAAERSAGVLLVAADGASAELLPPFPLPVEASAGGPADVLAEVDALASAALADRSVAVLLVRRGGYAVALIRAGRLVASRTGTRYVQGRTAAGGWSQQRFARRRDNQTSALVAAIVETALRVLAVHPEGASGRTGPVEPGGQAVEWLATGGDRALVGRVMADPRLAGLSALRRGPHLPVGDPRRDVVRALPELLRQVTVVVREP
ncbi:MAG: hypothetical protein GXX79_04595 [Actinomycetales bacterium]|nr:hypothetical protein [Actinomycetales bacterium]